MLKVALNTITLTLTPIIVWRKFSISNIYVIALVQNYICCLSTMDHIWEEQANQYTSMLVILMSSYVKFEFICKQSFLLLEIDDVLMFWPRYWWFWSCFFLIYFIFHIRLTMLMLRLSLLIILIVVFIYFLLSQIIWCHDIAEILLKLALLTNQSEIIWCALVNMWQNVLIISINGASQWLSFYGREWIFVTFSFIYWKRSTQRKPPTCCCKSITYNIMW